MNLEKLKENNQIVQESQVVPSVVPMHYYLVELTVLKDIYDWNKSIKEELPTIISEIMEKEFQIMKQKLQDSEEEQTLKFKKIKWKTRLIAFSLGLLLLAIWFLTHK